MGSFPLDRPRAPTWVAGSGLGISDPPLTTRGVRKRVGQGGSTPNPNRELAESAAGLPHRLHLAPGCTVTPRYLLGKGVHGIVAAHNIGGEVGAVAKPLLAHALRPAVGGHPGNSPSIARKCRNERAPSPGEPPVRSTGPGGIPLGPLLHGEAIDSDRTERVEGLHAYQ